MLAEANSLPCPNSHPHSVGKWETHSLKKETKSLPLSLLRNILPSQSNNHSVLSKLAHILLF